MNELVKYIYNQKDGNANFELAEWYFNNRLYSPASSFYLRSAEFTTDNLLRYKSLIKLYLCFNYTGGRNHTCESILKSAASILHRPEALYYLAQLYQNRNDWLNVYLYSNMGLNLYDNMTFEDINVNYPGKYGLILQKASSSWHMGQTQQTRDLFFDLIDNYWQIMDDHSKKYVEYNITIIGIGPIEVCFKRYNKKNYDNLRFKFTDSEKIEHNYSQLMQDMFVLSVLNGYKNGFFLEIGGGDPYHGNNTFLLEQNYNWRGISIEYNNELSQKYSTHRSSISCINQNALEIDYTKLLDSFNLDNNIIDYLQLDIEPYRNTYSCLTQLPFHKYKFRVITYEHDHYVDVEKIYRQKSREFLQSKGYIMVINDVSPNNKNSIEDWWVHPDLIDKSILQSMMDYKFNEINNISDYFLV